MSQENVELVRRAYEHFAQTGELDASVYSSDIEWQSAAEDPTVVAGLLDRGKGKGSDAQVEMREWNVFLIQGQKIVSVHEYGDREDAVRAAGLAE